MKVNTYLAMEKTYYTDTTGSPMAVSSSKKKLIAFIRKRYPRIRFNRKENWFEHDASQTLITIYKVDQV